MKHRSVVTSTPPAADEDFDYVIIGGGLTGLTVASRLSADPAIRVLTIEAGLDDRDASATQDVFEFMNVIGGPLDWAWKTEDGVTLGGGKTLGGSSSINGVTWTRGQDSQFDAWNDLLEPSERAAGWGWGGPEGLLAYMQKSETFHPPDAAQRSSVLGMGATFDPSVHGGTGPVQASFPSHQHMASAQTGMGIRQRTFLRTCEGFMGLKHGTDINAGKPGGVWVNPMSIDPARNDHRSSSAEAYLTPVENTRPNWTVLVGYMVTRILFAASSDTGARHASAVEFSPMSLDGTDTGRRLTVRVKKEVILAAGAIQTPALLQLSGIGPPNLLASLGITTVVPLEGVGKNLQEQPAIPFEVNTTISEVNSTRLPSAMAFPDIFQLFSVGALNSNLADVSKDVYSNIDRWAEIVASKGGGVSGEALRSIFEIQARTIVSERAPIAELFYYEPIVPRANGLGTSGVATWNLLPFSRGSVTITSSNPFEHPHIRVGYFDVDFDLQVSIATLRAARRLFRSEPFSTILTTELLPGINTVPDTDGEGGSDDDWRRWIMSIYRGNSHQIGTAAMMRRDLGGVVDAHLKIYGTANVRVVDASIMPLQVSAHISAALYGIAEKAATIIIQDS